MLLLLIHVRHGVLQTVSEVAGDPGDQAGVPSHPVQFVLNYVRLDGVKGTGSSLCHFSYPEDVSSVQQVEDGLLHTNTCPYEDVLEWFTSSAAQVFSSLRA